MRGDETIVGIARCRSDPGRAWQCHNDGIRCQTDHHHHPGHTLNKNTYYSPPQFSQFEIAIWASTRCRYMLRTVRSVTDGLSLVHHLWNIPMHCIWNVCLANYQGQQFCIVYCIFVFKWLIWLSCLQTREGVACWWMTKQVCTHLKVRMYVLLLLYCVYLHK